MTIDSVRAHLAAAQEQADEVEDESTRYALQSLIWAVSALAGLRNTPAGTLPIREM